MGIWDNVSTLYFLCLHRHHVAIRVTSVTTTSRVSSMGTVVMMISILCVLWSGLCGMPEVVAIVEVVPNVEVWVGTSDKV